MENIEKYRNLSDLIISKINKIFTNITFLTVDEIIKGEVKLNSIWQEVSNIGDTNNKVYRMLSKELSALSDEDYDNWGYKLQDEIDSLNNVIEWKIMSLQSLIDTLEKVVDIEEDDQVLKHFKDIKTIEI